MGYFKSSVAVDATADEAFAFLDDDAHLRSLVSTIEPDETFDGPGGPWFHPGAVFHHRIDWHATHSHGYVWVIQRGDASDLVAEVRTEIDEDGLDQRLDAALFATQEAISARQAAPARVPRPEESASFVVEEVLKGLARHLPADHRPQLDPYLVRAPGLDGSPEKEAERADLCRAWSDATAAVDHSGLGRRAVGFIDHLRHVFETADEGYLAAEGATVRDAEAEAERHGRRVVQPAVVEGLDPAGVPPDFRHELDESYEAVSEAVHRAAHRGWDQIDWNSLLDQLFAV